MFLPPHRVPRRIGCATTRSGALDYLTASVSSRGGRCPLSGYLSCTSAITFPCKAASCARHKHCNVSLPSACAMDTYPMLGYWPQNHCVAAALAPYGWKHHPRPIGRSTVWHAGSDLCGHEHQPGFSENADHAIPRLFHNLRSSANQSRRKYEHQCSVLVLKSLKALLKIARCLIQCEHVWSLTLPVRITEDSPQRSYQTYLEIRL